LEPPLLCEPSAQSAPGSNLKAKRKRLSIVFAKLFAAKQGAPEASVSSDTARLCDRCVVAPPKNSVHGSVRNFSVFTNSECTDLLEGNT